MPRWVCPDCGRQFGRTKQGHECAPAMTLEEFFSLHRTVSIPRVARKVIDTGRSRYHVVNVRGPDEVDEVLCEWLTEAYFTSPE